MEKFTVKYQVIVLIILGILGSIALGTFALSMEGLFQIVFAIGAGLVCWYISRSEFEIYSRPVLTSYYSLGVLLMMLSFAAVFLQ
jgi:hypothetical protein